MGIYIGLVIIDPSIIQKLSTKHQVTVDDVREALQWPALVQVAREDHPNHGVRWVALARTSTDRELLAVLLPAPAWAGEDADTWVVKTARWV